MKALLKLLPAILLFAGCATVEPQAPVPFNSGLTKAGNTISFSMSELPAVRTAFPGADCLLCIAAAATMNSGLSGYVKTLSNAEVGDIGTQLKQSLISNGYDVKELDAPINVKRLKKFSYTTHKEARKDYRALADSLGTTHVLVFDIDFIGVVRQFSAYVPTGDPYSLVSGTAYLVDLRTNTYEWYMPIEEKNSVGNEWKEPPSYPGLTNALYQSVESLKDKMVTSIGAVSSTR